MKKVICVLAGLAALCSGLFAESIKKEIDIKEIAAFLESDEFYNADSVTLQIKDNFKPEDVTVSEIEALSKFVAHDSDNKIEGPIEYIYFDGTHSSEVFYEIRQKIENAKEKYVCVDISLSDYFVDYYGITYPLPKNVFAGHENLYWVYFGFFGSEDVPANICKDCNNLQFVMMWSYGKVDTTAFSGVNESAKLYDRYGNEAPLTSIHHVDVAEYEDWDYFTFTEGSHIGEDFEEDDDYASYDQLFEDLVNYFYEESMKELDFSDLFGEEWLKISDSNAEQILSNSNFDKTNAYSTTIDFLCNYLLGGEKTDLESSLNELYTSVFDLTGLVFHIGEKGEEEDGDVSVFTVGIEGNDGAVRDICLLGLKKDEEGNWSITGLKSFCLLSFMINSILEE